MDILVTYLEKKQRESIQPLLELMTDFAHDLGPRFEKHYPKALELITSIAGTPQDVEVIEWSFTSLAFLFKYLSKLVVPDLRPTYDLMAPLLGKHRQRPHIARFAAEAMSFLVKKAGAPGQRDKSLPLIIGYAKADLDTMSDTKEFGLYYHGLMTMFAEAMKGNGLSIHTTGPSIFRTLVSALDDKDLASKEPSAWTNVIHGVLTSMIHHSSSDTFKELLETVLELTTSSVESFTQSQKENDFRALLLSSRMIGIVAGVRKGTRVCNWPGLLKGMSNVLKAVSKHSRFVVQHEDELDIWNGLIHSVAMTLQYSPMDAMIPFISTFMHALTKEPLAKWFLTFCSYLSESEPERFKSVVLPYFQRLVVHVPRAIFTILMFCPDLLLHIGQTPITETHYLSCCPKWPHLEYCQVDMAKMDLRCLSHGKIKLLASLND
jgi:U3 small nucleolar RNA-associated protein 20